MYKSHQLAIKNQSTSFPGNNNKEQPSNPFSNSNEEKTPAGSENIFPEEYIQHTSNFIDARAISLRHKSDFCISVYKNFNGELICPPPKA